MQFLPCKLEFTQTFPTLLEVESHRDSQDLSVEEVEGLVAFLAQALNYLEAKDAPKDASAMESLVTVLSRFTTKSEPLGIHMRDLLGSLALSSLDGHARFYFLGESSTILQVLHGHFSTGCDTAIGGLIQ